MNRASIVLLLLIGSNTSAFQSSSQTVVDAAIKGDLAALNAILKANPRLIDAPGEGGRSPLQEALLAGQGAAARLLVEAGADVNWRDSGGINPLHCAAFAGDVGLARLLVQRGAKVDARDSGLRATPLHIAALRGHVKLVQFLVEGAPLDARTTDGRTPLDAAVERGKLDCARVLLSRGAAVDSRDRMDRTTMHRAVLSRNAEIVKLLLAAKADPQVRSAYGNTPLDLALQEDLKEIAGLLSPSGNPPVPRFPSITGPYLGQVPPGLSPRLFAPGIVSTERDELNAVFTPDGSEFYFTIRGASGRWTIMVTKLEAERWSRPYPASFSGRWSDVDLFITADGRRLYFCSDRPLAEQSTTPKDFDIWMAEKSGDSWSRPVNLGPPVNSSADEFYPSLTKDGTIYFQSRRPGGPGQADIWRARPAAGGFGTAECLPPPVNSAGLEGDTFVAPDESYLIVSTRRDPQPEQADLFLSFPGPDGTWTPLVRLGFDVNSERSGENCQMLSPDGRYLFFTRDGDIYWVDSGVIERSREAAQKQAALIRRITASIH